MRYVKKRSAVLWFSYLIAALLVMGGFVYKHWSAAEGYKRYIEAGWQRSFNSLAASMSEIDTALQKTLYSSSPAMMGSACAEIYAKSLEAQASLSELPFSEYQLENTSGFIGRLGDYARALSLNAYAGGFESGEYDSLLSLADSAGVLSQNLIQLRADMDGGLLSIADWQQTLDSQFTPSFGQSFQSMEDEFPELPTLIYDGPYSQHIDAGAAKFIDNMDEVTQEQALQAAAKFTGVDPEVFDFLGRSEGRLPVYCFGAVVNAAELAVRVTVRGGIVMDMISSAETGYAELSESEALEKARLFLEQKGYSSMKDSYWTRNDNQLLINFAYSQDGVICYPDLIKVSVALDTGRICGFEATGYIMNHTERNIPQPISAEEARANVSQQLSEISHSLAIIPSVGKNELFCHEFKCENADGGHYIVYVNAITGKEEKLLILIEDENGTLTL